MPEVNNPNADLYVLIIIVAVIFLILIILGLALFFNDFSSELKYLNNEIGRSEGEERDYWIYRRRRLWLSLIPFVKY